MRKILTIVLLLAASSLTAGWKWEKLDIEVPYTNLGTTATYDPARQKIVLLNLNKEANHEDIYDMYLFDGNIFEKVCTRYPDSSFSCRLYSQSSLFWDVNLQKLITGQRCKEDPNSPYLYFWLLQEDTDLCWKPFKEGWSYNVGYDPVRKRAVFFSLNYNEIYEFDGTSVTTHSGFPIAFGTEAYITYDETTNKVIFFGWDSRPSVVLCEWDGQTLEVGKPVPPQGYDIRIYGPSSIAYHPQLGGSVALYSREGALLYKNKKWESFIRGKTPWGGLIVYYPPKEEMYLFSLSDGVFVLRRAHVRPFQKP